MNNTLIPLHPHTNLFGIEVPEDAENFYISFYGYLCGNDENGDYLIGDEKLPGKMELLGTVKNRVIYFDAFPILHENANRKFTDYTGKTDGFWFTDMAVASLMESNNLDLTKDYVILKQI